MNNKTHSATKVSLFIANYNREMRMEVDIRKKEKVEKITEFAERMKKIQEKASTVLRKAQKEMKWQASKKRREAKKWKKRDKMILNTKDLVFKERLVKKLVDWYISPYIIDEIVFTNIAKL